MGSILGVLLSSMTPKNLLLGIFSVFLFFPFLVLYMKYRAQMAAGANSLIVTVSSLVGAIGHFAMGHLDLQTKLKDENESGRNRKRINPK